MDWKNEKLTAKHSHGSRSDIFRLLFTMSELAGTNSHLSLVNALVETDGTVCLQPIANGHVTLSEDLKNYMIEQCHNVMEKEFEFVNEQTAWKSDAARIALLIDGKTIREAIRLLAHEGYT